MVLRRYLRGVHNSYVFALYILDYRQSLRISFLWGFSILYFNLESWSWAIFLDEHFAVPRKHKEEEFWLKQTVFLEESGFHRKLSTSSDIIKILK